MESFEKWCWRKLEKISWTDPVRNKEVLHAVKADRIILNAIKKKKANWICHILRRNCLLKHVTEGKVQGRIEVKERLGRRRKQLFYDLKETGRYWTLKEEALDYTLWENPLWKSLWTME
jgi:hypothetical protein